MNTSAALGSMAYQLRQLDGILWFGWFCPELLMLLFSENHFSIESLTYYECLHS